MILAVLAASACIAVSGSAIQAHHLAEAVPAFVPADPNAVVAYAPEPGVERVFPAAELRLALSHLGFTTSEPLENVCFVRPVAPISEEATLTAMHATLGSAAHIELVELSHTPAPIGPLVFPREGLGVPPIALWRGYVLYDGTKKFSVWARLKVTVPVARAIASEELKPGTPIRAAQIHIEQTDEFPERRATAQTAQALETFLPRRVIAAGTPVWDDIVQAPPAVERGDRVTVTVHSGNAQLSFDAEAQSAARLGEFVALKNPESGKTFRARVAARDVAALDTRPVMQ
jgi:flagella basal body P-ring formation protein FlgA